LKRTHDFSRKARPDISGSLGVRGRTLVCAAHFPQSEPGLVVVSTGLAGNFGLSA
jgi:hypothetical protein